MLVVAGPLLAFPYRTTFVALPATANGIHRSPNALERDFDYSLDVPTGTVVLQTDAEAAAGADYFWRLCVLAHGHLSLAIDRLCALG